MHAPKLLHVRRRNTDQCLHREVFASRRPTYSEPSNRFEEGITVFEVRQHCIVGLCLCLCLEEDAVSRLHRHQVFLHATASPSTIMNVTECNPREPSRDSHVDHSRSSIQPVITSHKRFNRNYLLLLGPLQEEQRRRTASLRYSPCKHTRRHTLDQRSTN
jgi:hypothetical protein